MLIAAAFAIAFFAGCSLALVRHPIFGLVTYVGVLYIHPPVTWWGKTVLPDLRWSLLAAVATLAGVLIHTRGRPSIPLSRFGLFWGILIFLGWILVQSLWAMDEEMHAELISLTTKYLLLLVLIYKCVDSERHLKLFLWAHVGGCFYLGYIVFTEYTGGRWEGFHSPGIDEANAGALQIVTAVVTAFALFLVGKWREKVAAVAFMPFIVNALVTTISRSGFIALGIAGLVFNLFVPKNIAGRVRLLSGLGLVLFISLTNPLYWERIGTILLGGEEVEGVDTGTGRLVLIEAQLEMFRSHPMGCGHRCTATLSPAYLPDEHLTGQEGNRARASHNTFMSLLVEQGIPGAMLYVLMLLWMLRAVLRLRSSLKRSGDILGTTFAASAAVLVAITVGDVFVDYLKYEARVWFLGLMMALHNLVHLRAAAAEEQLSPVPRASYQSSLSTGSG